MKNPRAEGELLLQPTGDYIKPASEFLLLQELGISGRGIPQVGQQSLF